MPVATPAATSNPLSYRGYIRVYDFTRQNASTGIGGAGATNQQSIEPAVSLHADYRLGAGFSVGGSYLYATPFNNCGTPQSHLTPPCGKVKPLSLNPDDTVPGYTLNTFYEAYLRYKGERLAGTLGAQVINTPWVNASDSRLKPVAFEGVDVSYQLPHGFSVDVMDMTRFESRTNSTFDNKTLLTSFNLGYSGMPSYIFSPGGTGFTTKGFQYGRFGYADPKGLTSNIYDYHFSDIANFQWFDAKYTFTKQRTKPYIAFQAGNERDTGASQIGKIDSQVFGAQIGATVTKTISVNLGFNHIPRHIDTLASLPAGISCNAKFQVAAKPGSTMPYFLPANGPECAKNSDGTYSVLYGGLASPYTDSYATDPLFTTSLTQGMADRRAPGDGTKIGATYTSLDKRLIVSVSRAYYDYGWLLGQEQTAETNADAQYYLSPLRKSGPYKGLVLRYRYGARTLDNVTTYGGAPLFKYNRAQFEYDF
jgi:outer membrane OprD family porin